MPCSIHPSPWPPGCSTTTPTATTRSRARSSRTSPSGNLTRDHILDNITTYWLTATGASAARSYWESGQPRPRGRPGSAAGRGPGRLHQFPGEIVRTPKSWVELAYPTLSYFNKADKAGHFAAWEEPELFSDRGAGSVQLGAVTASQLELVE